MKLKLLLSALFSFRNIAILLIAGGAAQFAGPQVLISSMQVYAYLGAVLIYAAFVVQSLTSPKFYEDFKKRQKIREIQDLNNTCWKLARDAKRIVNATYLKKLRKVMDDKDSIMNSFFKGEHGYLKEKIVEQTLNLVLAYIRLLVNYCVRSREIGTTDIGVIVDRINMNNRKLSFTKDPGMADDIRKLVEMDEKMLNRMKEEKNSLERISAKLDYMESTVNMFKHQIISNIESEEMLEKLETAVNEAAALDSVLEDRRINRMKI